MPQRPATRALTLSALGLAAFLALALYAFQDNLFRWWMDPRMPFQTTPPPAEPDYASAPAWLARPGAASADAPAVFFVHPTTYWGYTGWNAGLDDTTSNARLTDGVLATSAAPYAAVGAVWAPAYRQASLRAALTVRYDARQARQLAFTDVRAAFAQFLADAPPDAPLILAGVEQGGLHLLGVLPIIAADAALQDRLVAAYIVDQAVPLDLFDGPLAGLTPCREPTHTGCVMSFGAVREEEENEIDRWRRRSMAWSREGRLEPTDGRALLCVNPVFGAMTRDYAPRRLHRGAVIASGFAMTAPPAAIAAQTSAQCRDGVLLVDRPKSAAIRDPWRWGGRFKPPRANLFAADIAVDLDRRLAAFQAPSG